MRYISNISDGLLLGESDSDHRVFRVRSMVRSFASVTCSDKLFSRCLSQVPKFRTPSGFPVCCSHFPPVDSSIFSHSLTSEQIWMLLWSVAFHALCIVKLGCESPRGTDIMIMRIFPGNVGTKTKAKLPRVFAPKMILNVLPESIQLFSAISLGKSL